MADGENVPVRWFVFLTFTSLYYSRISLNFYFKFLNLMFFRIRHRNTVSAPRTAHNLKHKRTFRFYNQSSAHTAAEAERLLAPIGAPPCFHHTANSHECRQLTMFEACKRPLSAEIFHKHLQLTRIMIKLKVYRGSRQTAQRGVGGAVRLLDQNFSGKNNEK